MIVSRREEMGFYDNLITVQSSICYTPQIFQSLWLPQLHAVTIIGEHACVYEKVPPISKGGWKNGELKLMRQNQYT